MAKDQVGTIERHVEKIVLGVSLLIFLYAVAHWGVSSPRTIKIGSSDKSLSQVDKALADKALSISGDMERTKPETHEVQDLGEQFVALQDQPLPSGLFVCDLGSPAQEVAAEEGWGEMVKLSRTELASIMPAPQELKVWAGLELPLQEPISDRLTAHVSMVYPWAQLQKNWNEKLRKAATVLPQLLAVEVQAEYRQQDAAGQWGPWTALKQDRPALQFSSGQIVSGSQPPQAPAGPVDEMQARQLENQFALAQEQILEPEYWMIWWPGHTWVRWQNHLPTNSVALPPQPVEDTLPHRPLTASPPVSPTVRRNQPTAFVRATGGDEDDESMVFGNRGGLTPPRPAPTAPSPTRARPALPLIPGEAPPPEIPTIPSLPEQMLAGNVAAWLHTTALEHGKTYQLRVRLVVLNPLLGQRQAAASPADAQMARLESPWSQPSDLVYVPKTTEFFLTGYSPVMNSMRVTVFSQCLGQTLSRSFTVHAGDAIGETYSEKVINPKDLTLLRREVDYSTGAVAVWLDFAQRALRGGREMDTAELLYMDSFGNLASRVEAGDKDSSRYRQLREDAKRCDDAIKRAAAAEVGRTAGM